MQGLKLQTEGLVEVVAAYVGALEEFPAVDVEPGWTVVGTFHITVKTRARLELMGSVSHAGLTLQGRVFRLTPSPPAPVEGSIAQLIGNTIDARVVSGALELAAGDYQFQAQAFGSSGEDRVGVVKSMTLINVED